MGIFASIHCIAGELDSQTLSRLETIGALLEDQDSSYLDLSQQRIYLHPEKITLTA